jgi:hypothetical protein
MDKPTFRIRNDVDFIALAPIVLGFQPTHSLVMMTANSFHARVDLPSEDDVNECLDALVQPAIKHKVSGVAFLIFGEGEYDKLRAEIITSFIVAGIPILTALQVGDGKYRSFAGEWQPLDLSDHPLVLEAQYLDLTPKHMSRQELVDHIKPVGEDASDDVLEAIEKLKEEGIEATVMRLSREHSRAQAALWTEAFRSCQPGEFAQDVAVVLAFASWINGDGARAWVALDQGNPLSGWHRLVRDALEQAVDPAKWEAAREGRDDG